MHRCSNCEKLQEQIDDLKQELANLKADHGFTTEAFMKIRLALSVKDQSAEMLYLLYKANGRLLNYDYLVEALDLPETSDFNMRHIYVLCHLAKKHIKNKFNRDDVIITVKSKGYAMSSKGIKFIDELLKD